MKRGKQEGDPENCIPCSSGSSMTAGKSLTEYAFGRFQQTRGRQTWQRKVCFSWKQPLPAAGILWEDGFLPPGDMGLKPAVSEQPRDDGERNQQFPRLHCPQVWIHWRGTVAAAPEHWGPVPPPQRRPYYLQRSWIQTDPCCSLRSQLQWESIPAGPVCSERVIAYTRKAASHHQYHHL